jgi:FdhE protein
VAKNEWQQRAERANQLAAEHAASAEILRFFTAIASFQQQLSDSFESGGQSRVNHPPSSNAFAEPLPGWLAEKFQSLLPIIVEHGPASLAHAAAELRSQNRDSHAALLASFWQEPDGGLESGPPDFLARAFLQPYAVLVRLRMATPPPGLTPCLCPICGCKPGLGVLRPMGDGGSRSLVCSLCLNEWQFRRILCPACGEESHQKLPVYTAEEFPHVRVECCDACRCYIKTVDMTKTGLAEPVVDEIAAIPLDLWAQKHGYTKLQTNLMML